MGFFLALTAAVGLMAGANAQVRSLKIWAMLLVAVRVRQ